MKYVVFESDELYKAEDTIYVFEHSKIIKNPNYDIYSLEDFAAVCQFIEKRNTHWYWYKGENKQDLQLHEYEKQMMENQKEIKQVSKEEVVKWKEEFADDIKPFTFPNEYIRSGYVHERDWNECFFVIETETSYFGVYWFTTA